MLILFLLFSTFPIVAQALVIKQNVILKTSSNNARFVLGADLTLSEISLNSTHVWLNTSGYYAFHVWVTSPSDVVLSITDWFDAAESPNSPSTADFSITSPVTTDIYLSIYNPWIYNATVSGAVSYTFTDDNHTIGMVVNTSTSSTFTVSLNLYHGPWLTIEDLYTDKWVFAEDHFYIFNVTFPIPNLANLTLAFTDGIYWVYVSYDHVNADWTLDSGDTIVAMTDGVVDSSELGAADNWVTINLYFKSTVSDALNVDTYLSFWSTDDVDYGWYTDRADYFNIYNLGGLSESSSSGDGIRVSGGGIFDVAATTTGSWVRVNATWANFQHFHALLHWWSNTGWDTAGQYFDCPTEHSNTAYAEYGVDYWHNDSWLEGWKVRLKVDDGAAGTFGGGLDQAWVLVNATWYNRGEIIKSELFYAFYEASTSSDLSRQFSLWVDLWVSSGEASSTAAGKVTPQYYGMNETGWWLWATYAPIGGMSPYSSFSDYLKDEDGYVIRASELKLFKVWALLNKTSADGGDPDCDSHQYALLHEEIQWRHLASSSTLTGVDSPVFTITTTHDMPMAWWTSIVNSLVRGIAEPIQGALGAAGKTAYFVVASIIDSAFAYFGISGFTSIATSFITAFASHLSNSITYITSSLTAIYNIFTGTVTFILGMFAGIVGTFLTIAGIVQGILDGTYTVTTGFGNVWNMINIGSWMNFVYVIILVSWFDSVDKRAKRSGAGWVAIFVSDIQTIISVISFIFSTAMTVFNTVLDLVFRFIDAIPI